MKRVDEKREKKENKKSFTLFFLSPSLSLSLLLTITIKNGHQRGHLFFKGCSFFELYLNSFYSGQKNPLTSFSPSLSRSKITMICYDDDDDNVKIRNLPSLIPKL